MLFLIETWTQIYMVVLTIRFGVFTAVAINIRYINQFCGLSTRPVCYIQCVITSVVKCKKKRSTHAERGNKPLEIHFW